MCKHADIRRGWRLSSMTTRWMHQPGFIYRCYLYAVWCTYGAVVHVHITLLCRCTSWIIYQMKTGGTRMSQSQKTRSWSGQMSGAPFPHQTFQMGILFPSLCVWMRKQTVTSASSLQVHKTFFVSLNDLEMSQALLQVTKNYCKIRGLNRSLRALKYVTPHSTWSRMLAWLSLSTLKYISLPVKIT